MNPEESKSPQTPGQEPQAAPPAPEKPSGKTARSRVTVYLAVLFAAALLLLVMSFFMQQRSHQALEDLNESMSASQNMSALQLELQQAQFELRQAQDDLAMLEDVQDQVEDLEKQTQALEWLRQMEAAVRTSYTEAKALVEQFESTDLADYLPNESVVEGKDSPADTYRKIYAMFY